MFIKSHWWKIVGIVLLLYVLFTGLLVPLKPGIYAISERMATESQALDLKVTGYNSHFKAAESSLKAWLKIDTTHYGIQARKLNALNDLSLQLKFDIPAGLKFGEGLIDCTLLIHNSIDGTTLYPDGISIRTKNQEDSTIEQPVVEIPYSELFSKPGFYFPYRNILHETIRNTFFHVALWFSMFILLIISLVYSIKVLKYSREDDDMIASSFTSVAVVYGLLGIATGSLWARYTWGQFWTTDIKLNMAAIAMLIYLSYIVLRASLDDNDNRAKVSAVYNIFAFVALIPLVFIIPRLTSSLHPGNGGNPALGSEDLDNTLRLVFYPSIIGLTLLGCWISSLKIRLARLQKKLLDRT